MERVSAAREMGKAGREEGTRRPGASGGRVGGPVAVLLVSAMACTGQELAETPIVGLPCEGCEAVFDGMPSVPPTVASLTEEDEPGEPMHIQGRVRDPRGDAVPGVVVYAYHTDDRGVYPRDESSRGRPSFRHGRLRGWARTDANGRYRFHTIRPAGYPDVVEPAHVHMHVIEPGRCTYYISSIRFSDDPRLSPEQMREAAERGRGGPGLVQPALGADGTWMVNRDIVLGEGVPGYERCSEGGP